MNYYIYVLHSLKDGKFYTGYTNNLKQRLQAHTLGKVDSTKNRRPFRLIYFEGCFNQDDALKREKYLKSTYGKRYLKNRNTNYLQTNEYFTG